MAKKARETAEPYYQKIDLESPLKTRKQNVEAQIDETGRYYGLDELPILENNPGELDRFRDRVRDITIAGREQVRQVAASSLVREVGELATAIYTPEGFGVLQSTGIVIHVPLMGDTIRYMIENDYEEDPGINPGDNFTSNDNRITGLHPPDVYDLMPVFYDNKIVAWVGTVIMEAENGGILGSTMPGSGVERYENGVRFYAEKSAEDNNHTKSFVRRIEGETRLDEMYLTSRRGALSGNIKIREEIKDVIDDFGLEFFIQACRELIERENQGFRERVKRRTVPGKFEEVTCMEERLTLTQAAPLWQKDYSTLIPWSLQIQDDGKLKLDFDGTGPFRMSPHNTTPEALKGTMSLLLSQIMSYYGDCNEGTVANMEMNTPPGSKVNPMTDPVGEQVSPSNFFSAPVQCGGLLHQQFSRAFYSRGYAEESQAGYESGTTPEFAGVTPNGVISLLLTDAAGTTPSGGFARGDGYTGQVVWLPPGDMGNEEVWELLAPVTYLGRNYIKDAVGWGEHRSGPGFSVTFRTELPEQYTECAGAGAQTYKTLRNAGMYGGYNGPQQWTKLARIDFDEMIEEKGSYPIERDESESLEAYAGEENVETMDTRTTHSYDPVPTSGDIFHQAHVAAGGVGDPIERDVEGIEEDLKRDIVSPERCKSIFKVELEMEDGEWTVDEEATEQTREAERQRRIENAVDVESWWNDRREELQAEALPPILKKAYNESLEMGEAWSERFRKFWDLPSEFTFDVPDDYEPYFDWSDRRFELQQQEVN
jgi:N-methylhydantoinase B/oxoprolinase/acetone carboxylase alpha subunit